MEPSNSQALLPTCSRASKIAPQARDQVFKTCICRGQFRFKPPHKPITQSRKEVLLGEATHHEIRREERKEGGREGRREEGGRELIRETKRRFV